jgi:hypothetical protein
MGPSEEPGAADASQQGGATAAVAEKSPEGPAVIPVAPPLKGAPASDLDVGRSLDRLDRFLVFLVLVLAFLLASTPARNSDIWLHLATGKMLADGQYQVGVYPFSYASEATYWVNHSWLYDGLLYLLYQVIGGTGLVVLKALLVVGLGVVLVLLGRTERSGLAAVTAAAALVAMGPWLELRPMSVSFLFLGLTLWFLQKGWQKLTDNSNPAASLVGRALAVFWPVVVLFAFWVNLDSWFFLGPLTMGLWLLGKGLEPERTKAGTESGTGAPAGGRFAATALVVLGAAVAACLVNPHLTRAFQLPTQLGLSEVAGRLNQDADLELRYLAPFQDLYFSSGFKNHAAGVAYWLLVIGGAASFLVRRSPVPWSRVLIFGMFLFMSVSQKITIPFFAVVAAPMLAANVGEWLSGLPAREKWERWALRARLVPALGGLALVAAAWPGWLQAGAALPEPRSWTITPDPSLKNAAKQISEWRTARLLDATANGLNFSPEAANYFAWFCPQEKGFVDGQFQVSANGAADYIALRRILLTPVPLQDRKLDWRVLMRKQNINHVVVHSPKFQLTKVVASNLLAQPEEWVLLYLEGNTLIFGWRDPARKSDADPFEKLRLNVDVEAFQRPQARPAPASGPERDPQTFQWWEAFVKPRTVRSPERDEAELWLLLFDSVQPRYAQRARRLWNNVLFAGNVAAGVSPGIPHLGWAVMGPQRLGPFLLTQDQGPPAALFLAVRAARRALHTNPDDAQAHLLLGNAYYRLGTRTRERSWAFPELGQIRTPQIITALTQALRLDPTLGEAHAPLEKMFRGLYYWDLTLKHLKGHYQYVKARGPAPGESEENFSRRLAILEARIEKGEESIRNKLEDYDVLSSKMELVDKVRLAGQGPDDDPQKAREWGLAGKALELLLASDIGEFLRTGLKAELELLINTGNVDKARAWIHPDQEPLLHTDRYHWLKAQIASVTGDYREADQEMELILSRAGKPIPFHSEAVFSIANMVLSRRALVSVDRRLSMMVSGMHHQAKHDLVRGLLALEQGQTEQARRLFEHGRDFWRSPVGQSVTIFDPRPLRIAEQCLRMLDSAGPERN